MCNSFEQICRRNRSKLTGNQWSFWVDLPSSGKKKSRLCNCLGWRKIMVLFLLDKIPNYLRLVVLVYCTMLGLNGFDTSPGWYMNSVMNWWIANLNWCRIFWSNCAIAMNLPKFVIFVNPCWRQLVEVDFIRFHTKGTRSHWIYRIDIQSFQVMHGSLLPPKTTKSRTTWKSSWNEKRNHSSPNPSIWEFQNVPFRRRTDSAPEHCFKRPTAFMRVPSMKWGNIALMHFFPKIFQDVKVSCLCSFGGPVSNHSDSFVLSVMMVVFNDWSCRPLWVLGMKISCNAVFIFSGQRFIAIKGNPWSLVVGTRRATPQWCDRFAT